MFAGEDAPWHWLVLVILVLILFGYKRLPDAARSIGRSLRIFKTEMSGLVDDDNARSATGPEQSSEIAPVVMDRKSEPSSGSPVVGTSSVPPGGGAPDNGEQARGE